MTEQIRKIAADEEFTRLYNSGVSRQDLANMYGVSYRTVNSVIEFCNLLPVNRNDLAPTPEEEAFSRENLALSPAVFEASEPFRRRYEKRQEAEHRVMTCNQNFRWRSGL